MIQPSDRVQPSYLDTPHARNRDLSFSPSYIKLLQALERSANLEALAAAIAPLHPDDIELPLSLDIAGDGPRTVMCWIAAKEPTLIPLAAAAGANVNQLCPYTNRTPLYFAVATNNALLVKRVLDLGAKPAFGGVYPLRLAVLNENVTIFNLLVVAGGWA